MVERTGDDSLRVAGNVIASKDPQNPNKEEKSAPDMTSTGQDLTESILEPAANLLVTAASKPEAFYRKDDALAEELTGVLQKLFAFARKGEARGRPYGPFDQLYVDGLDCESIWAELELRNAALQKHAGKMIARLQRSEHLSLAADLDSGDEDGGDDEADEADEADEDDEDDEAEGEGDQSHAELGSNENSDPEEQEDDEQGEGSTGRGSRKSKAVDAFFDAEDMERFADEGTLDDDLDDDTLDKMYGGAGNGNAGGSGESDQEASGGSSEEEDDAELEDMVEHDEQAVGGGIKYGDFFDRDGLPSARGKGSSRRRDASRAPGGGDEDGADAEGSDEDTEGDEDEGDEDEGDEGEGDEGDESRQSAHAARTDRLKKKVNEHERELVAEKPWMLRGEVVSKDRPQNSLLEASVDVDRATRAAPLPTPERALKLEDMIKKRCLDENWDDVMPRYLEGPAARQELPDVSQEKSKEGLGDLYEKEFLKKTMGVEEADPKAPLKEELGRLFAKLCGKLDALCNFHYTPRAVVPEMKVNADVAAIAMEEVLPSSVADAEALAPEEVYAKKRGRGGEFLEAEEMTQTDRKRVRSSKKAARRKARRQAESEQKLVSKLNPGLGNKYEKTKMLRDIRSAKNVTSMTGDEASTSTGKDFTTSAKFFTRLQETVKETVKAARPENGVREKAQEARVAQLRL